MPKFIGVMGSGLVGRDPYEENAWSGSSRFFFRECERQGLLQRAFGVEVAEPLRMALMLRNFSTDRDHWRQKFYLDTRYYDLLSRRIVRGLRPDEESSDLLQIGGIYHLRPLLRPGRRLFSYHDGNLAQALRSPEFPQGVPRRYIDRALAYEKRVYDDIDLIFTMSEYLRQSFIDDFGIPASRVKTIGAGINFDALPAPFPQKGYEKQRLLFLGADFVRKGGLDLLAAFKTVREALPKAELDIVGPRELAIPAALATGVNYHGFISKGSPAGRQQLDQLLKDASLFVMPSLYEPFGIAPLEAMAHQIPVVLSRAWAFPEMVTPGVNGELVNAASPAELAEKVIALLRDPGRLETMGQAARETVVQKFTWPAVVTKMREQLLLAH